uniref:Uncharacterized protein n=1 Tax=Anguilla anguilla TaxID=7936 RepID=A0A0E9T3R7_ANGAN
MQLLYITYRNLFTLFVCLFLPRNPLDKSQFVYSLNANCSSYLAM